MENDPIFQFISDYLPLFILGSGLFVVISFKMAIIKTSIPCTADIFKPLLSSKKIDKKTGNLYNFLALCLLLLSPVFLFTVVYVVDTYFQ